MNRRDILKLLSIIPFIPAAAKAAPVETKAPEEDTEAIRPTYDGGGVKARLKYEDRDGSVHEIHFRLTTIELYQEDPCFDLYGVRPYSRELIIKGDL